MIWRWKNGPGWVKADLHNTAGGMPVIIACNGPSIATMDTARFCGAGRLVIGVNNVYPRLRPDLWVGMDKPGGFDSRLFHEPFPKILRGNHGDEPLHDGLPAKWARSTFFANVDPKADFYDWAENAPLRWSKNTFTIAMQLALWMGSREIYFAGVDLHHADGDYADGNYLTPEQRAINAQLHAELFAFLEEFRTRAAWLGVRVTSCSPSSRLNSIMRFLQLDEVLAGMESSAPRHKAKTHCTAL